MRNLTNGLLLAALLALPGALAAQALPVSASVNATATVLANLTVTGQQDLAFGEVIPGISSTVSLTEATDLPRAGLFLIGGTGTYGVSLDFGALPTSLGGPGGASLPLTFGGESAGYGTDSNAVPTTFDPSAGATTNLVGGELYVFIGGTVTPDTGQPEGDYTGTITLTVAYTGS